MTRQQKPKQDMPELKKMIAKFKEITTPKFEQVQKAHSKFVNCKCLTKQEKDWLIDFIIEKSGQQTALAIKKEFEGILVFDILNTNNWWNELWSKYLSESEIKKREEGK